MIAKFVLPAVSCLLLLLAGCGGGSEDTESPVGFFTWTNSANGEIIKDANNEDFRARTSDGTIVNSANANLVGLKVSGSTVSLNGTVVGSVSYSTSTAGTNIVVFRCTNGSPMDIVVQSGSFSLNGCATPGGGSTTPPDTGGGDTGGGSTLPNIGGPNPGGGGSTGGGSTGGGSTGGGSTSIIINFRVVSEGLAPPVQGSGVLGNRYVLTLQNTGNVKILCRSGVTLTTLSVGSPRTSSWTLSILMDPGATGRDEISLQNDIVQGQQLPNNIISWSRGTISCSRFTAF